MKFLFRLFLGWLGVGLCWADMGPRFHGTECEGAYSGHLQGICTDGRSALFWSWTTQLVKTDTEGRVLRSVPVASHHGDLCYRQGLVYVAVNLGLFNQPAGKADSWVFVYDAETLKERGRHAVPEAVHGAGGIACHGDIFVVVGGLPSGVDENYLYEYSADFRFRGRHVLASGHTEKGIQTVAYSQNSWWFGTYSEPRTLLRADDDFRYLGKWESDAALGIAPLEDRRFLIGSNVKGADGRFRGRIRVMRFDSARGLVP